MYEDIINLPHHISKTHPQMPMSDRAAQFSPFAALTGYDAAINEAGRLTCKKIILSEDAKEDLDRKMHRICSCLSSAPAVIVTYYEPDPFKEGGAYKTITGQIKCVNDVERILTMSNGTNIPLDDVFDLKSSSIYTE